MVTRVDKFLGGLGKDVTNIANVHATENRITFGGLENPSANAHVVGTVLASTNAIVGAEIVTSGHTLDVRGTANVGALTATGITIGSAGISEAELEILDGATLSTTELNYVDGVTSAVQTQLDAKADLAGDTFTGVVAVTDSTSSTSKTTGALKVTGGISTQEHLSVGHDIQMDNDGAIIWMGSGRDVSLTHVHNYGIELRAGTDNGGFGIAGNSNPIPTGISLGTPANAVLRVHAASGAANLIIGDATITSPYNLDVRGTANVGALTATGITIGSAGISEAELEILDGATLSTTELNYVDGVTSAIQTQLGTKAAKDGSDSFTGAVTITDSTATSSDTTGALKVTGGISTQADLGVGDDIFMDSDGAILNMGDNNDVTITHIHDTGIAVNLGLGLAGNTAPTATGISLGTPAKVSLRTHAASGAANLIIGDATLTSPYNLDVRGTANVGALTSTSATLTGDIIIPDGASIGSVSRTDLIKLGVSGYNFVTFGSDIKIPNDGYIGSAGASGALRIDSGGDVKFSDGLGVAGNSNPISTGISLGTPANVSLRTHAASGAANLIIGDATLTSPYNLDVRGTANVGALTTTGITIGSAGISEAELEILDGATLSTTELNYVDGVTSAIQTQLAAHTTEDTAIETRRTNNIAGAISSVLTSDLTASRVMVTDGSGKISVDTGVTATELGYLDATSSIQTQLDAAGGGGGSAGTGSLKGLDPTSTDYIGANHDCGAFGSLKDAFLQTIGTRTDLDLFKQPLYSLGTIDNGSVA